MTFFHQYATIVKMPKISNDLLKEISCFAQQNPSFSLKDCCIKLGYMQSTVYNWYTKLKKKTWNAGYSRTEDKQPLSEEVIDDFVNAFAFTDNSRKILKRLVSAKCLQDKYCYSKQMKVLKNIYKKYPNLDFWLNVDFGEPKDDILFYIGKNEKYIHEKYLDFTKKDSYTKFEYNYKPEQKQPPKQKKKKNIWDFY